MPEPLTPPPYRVDDESLAADCDLEVFTAGGPGGQHRNKTQNGVRLVHRPSGIRVMATERRSLEANRRAAFERLRARLEKLNNPPPPRRKTRPSRGSIERRLAAKAHTGRRKRERSAGRDE